MLLNLNKLIEVSQMNNRKKEQMKIASILFDLGLDEDLICAMTSLSEEDLEKLYQS
jgi:hypothetical protein